MSFRYTMPSVDITCDECGAHIGWYCLKYQGVAFARLEGWRIGKTCLCPNCNPKQCRIANPADSKIMNIDVLEGM